MKEVCIVGLGPAGIGALYRLAQSKIAPETVCIEAGVSLPEKKCQLAEGGPCANEIPCEIVSGVGGCSSISGAKLSGYPAGGGLTKIIGSTEIVKDKLNESLSTLRCLLPLQEEKRKNESSKTKLIFQEMGFEYRHYPVYRFDQVDLATAYKQILLNAQSAGVSVLLRTEALDITRVGEHYKLLLCRGSTKFELETKYLVLAVGFLGQSLVQNLDYKLLLSKKEYHLDVGVRIEFPSELFPEIDKHHGDLKLLFKNARTFCICKGGRITPYRNDSLFSLEGSLEKGIDTGFTNLAITIRREASLKNLKIFNDILANVRKESGGIPVNQTLPEYLNYLDSNDSLKSPSTFCLWKHGKIDNCFPFQVAQELKDAVQYFASKLIPEDNWHQVNVFAPELDFRLMFPLQKDFSIAPKLYMAGDCTGRFRGILQAFCSGEICANNILANLNGENIK